MASVDIDYYKLLNISPNATADDIKRAYRKQSIRYHPDQNTDPDVIAKFYLLTKAKDDLLDEEIRYAYDAKRIQKEQEARRRDLLNGRRKQLAEDLERREGADVKRKREDSQLDAELQRIAEDGRRRREAKQRIREQARTELDVAERAIPNQDQSALSDLDRTLKVRVSSEHEVEESDVRKIFGSYGAIETIIKTKRKLKSQRNGSIKNKLTFILYVLFADASGARAAYEDRHNLSPVSAFEVLEITLTGGRVAPDVSVKPPERPTPATTHDNGSLEEQTMLRLKRAARKKLDDHAKQDARPEASVNT